MSRIRPWTNGDQVPLEADLSVPVSAKNTGVVSTLNSYDSSVSGVLGVGGVFTGASEDLLTYGTVILNIKSDVASATDGLSIQYSSDGTNWDHEDVYTVPAATGKNYTVQRVARYFRVVYTNGGIAQTYLRLQVIANQSYIKPSSHRTSDSITSEDDATLGISLLKTVGRTQEEFHTVSDSHPLPTADYDNSHRGAANSVFGDKIVGTRVPSIAAQFQYGLRSDDATTDVVTTGTTAINDAMLELNTGVAADGHVGIQGADYIRYVPGHECYAFFTSVFAPAVADSEQRVGLYDYDGGNGNGFFIGYSGTAFGVTRRRAGVDTFTAVDVSTVFPPDSGVFDPTKGNVYKISFGYLGFATIHFEVMLPHAGFVEMAAIEYPNSATETHIANTNIPLRAEMTNTGNTTDLQMKIGSVSAGIVDGGGSDPMARIFTFPTGVTTIGSGTTQLIHFRNKSTFFGITNKISSQLMLLSASTDGNKPVSWGIKKNATLTVPGTWADVDAADSVMEYSLDAVANLTTGSDLILWDMARADSFFEDVEKYLVKLRPNDWATIYVTTTVSNDVSLSVRWSELF